MDCLQTHHPVVQQTLDYLCKRYQPSLIFLYGSFADEKQTATSDIDILCFAGVSEFIHDSMQISAHQLDAWIHPLVKIKDIVEFKHILPCKVLLDRSGNSETLLAQLRAARASSAEMTTAEREQYLCWLDKMFNRAGVDTAEGNYRYHWLLFEFPESYCRLRGEYFDGPVKTLRRMELSHPALFARYEALLAGEKSVAQLVQLYDAIKMYS